MIHALLAFVAGLLIGSFLNVCIYRMTRDEPISVLSPRRSFCPFCKATIAWYDNIPLLSFLVLGARCRHCGERIALRYPIVELLTGLLFFAAVLGSGLSLASLKLCTFSALIVGLVFADLEERILPDEFTLGGAALGLILAALVPFEEGLALVFVPLEWGPRWASLIEAALGAAVGSALLWIVGELYLRIRKREGLGFGDVKMLAMIGAFLGLHGAMLVIILGSLLGSVLGLAYIFVTRKDASTYELPFGTFLGAAALAVAFLRERMLTYLWNGSG
jgi:leader peptidase (prepilin peptidase)/N-methyltransferase